MVPRADYSLKADLFFTIGAFCLVLLIGAVIFALVGAPPLKAMAVILQEAFGSGYGISETLLKATPLAFCALAVTLALKVDLWNIGAEGQFFMGAFGATLVALMVPNLPNALQIPVLLTAGAVAGGIWALIPALLKVYGKVNEIISTLMLNYIAIAWVELLVYGPWKGKDGFPYTAMIGSGFELPLLYKRVHLGIVIVIFLAALFYLIEKKTIFGYQIRILGASLANAKYGGIPVLSRLLLVMTTAGAMGGLAGATVISGAEHRLHAGISAGYGYTAILIAFLARKNFLAAIVISLFFAALSVGGDGLQIVFPGVSSAIVHIFEGVLLLTVLAGSTLSQYQIALRGKQ